jgi:hypothetical protein
MPIVELLGRHGFVALVGAYHGEDVVALDVLERPDVAGRVRARERETHLLGQVLRIDSAAAREDDRALDGVLELTDVSRPPVPRRRMASTCGSS